MKQPTQYKFLQDTKVLVVDDEEILAWSIDTELKSHGVETQCAGSIREALERFNILRPDVIITDLRLPDGNGMELLQKWRLEYPDLPIILITAHGAVDSAIEALRLGAFDYLQKPFDLKNLMASANRAADVSKLRQKVNRFSGYAKRISKVDIVGQSPQVEILKQKVDKIAKSKTDTALVLGNSGTGKELAARAIHLWSERASQPFVEINCASIPETLLESELFGYEKGAFTDARERKLGLFELAKNGTIFLDEIGELPFKLQSKLLRALEYRRFKRLGGTKDIEFTARVVAATNRNLLQDVADEKFRADLYYRLNVISVEIPDLAERVSDIPLLTEYFLKAVAKELEVTKPKCTPEALQKLMTHPWPGNIRELRNVIKRAMVFYEPEILMPEHIELDPIFANMIPAVPMAEQADVPTVFTAPQSQPPQALTSQEMPAASYATLPAQNGSFNGGTVQSLPLEPDRYEIPDEGIDLTDWEKKILMSALEKAHNNQTKAARLLGISRHTLRYRMEKHGIEH